MGFIKSIKEIIKMKVFPKSNLNKQKILFTKNLK